MIRLRLFPLRWLGLCCIVLAMWMTNAARADTIAVERASLEADGSTGWSLDARFSFDLNSSLEDAVNRGIPLYFSTEFVITRGRWYWFDEETVRTQQSVRLSFQPLTREYRVSTGSGLQLAFPSLKDALAVVQHVTSWHVIDRNQVSSDTTYQAAVRMQLDIAQMPKPFQIDAVNNRDWNLASDWKRFSFTVSDHGKQ